MSTAPAPAPFRFDIESVLSPISPEAPSGENLRYDSIYDEIRTARQEDDPVLDQGVWKAPLKKADWAAVERNCVYVLMHRSKDLQVACWLLEAWTHQRGFAGAAEGLRLISALCEVFWDDMYPQLEDGDLEFRIAPFDWLNEKIPLHLKLLPITAPQSEDVKTYCWADWEIACRPKRPGEQDDSEDNGKPTQAKFQQSALLSPTPYLRSLLRQIEAVMDASAEVESVLENRLGREAPSLRQFDATMEPIRGLIAGIVSQRAPEVHPEVPVEVRGMPQNNRSDSGAAAAPAFSSTGPITSRAEAYMRLEEAADYLARTEPHSPTPYLVRRAIAWGSMRLEDLLPELVQNRGELEEIFRLLQMYSKR